MNDPILPCHSYIFFDTEIAGGSVSNVEREREEESFLNFIEERAAKTGIIFHSYATLGFKAGTRFMLHVNAAKPEGTQLFLRDILHTPLGSRLKVSYTLFGMTRESPYKPSAAQTDPKPAAANQPHKYLIVYPFTKTIEWHLLPFEKRREVMKAHVEVGRKWSKTVSQLLLYSYGIDDHEFVVSYYTDNLDDFQSLVMDMRATESRRHTKSDTPIFLCIHALLAEALSML